MKNKRNELEERIARLAALDANEIWLDLSIEPEELIEIDPLQIPAIMLEAAERPELDEPIIRALPELTLHVADQDRG